MKKVALFVILSLLVSAPVVWGQVYPAPSAASPAQQEGSLSDTQGLLHAEEERLERLRSEVSVLKAVLQQAENLREEARKAERAAAQDSAVSIEEHQSYVRVVHRAREVLGRVGKRFNAFLQEITGAEKEIARLKRVVLRLKLEAEAARIEEAASGK